MKDIKKAIAEYDSIIEECPEIDIFYSDIQKLGAVNDGFFEMVMNSYKLGLVRGMSYCRAREEAREGSC